MLGKPHGRASFEATDLVSRNGISGGERRRGLAERFGCVERLHNARSTAAANWLLAQRSTVWVSHHSTEPALAVCWIHGRLAALMPECPVFDLLIGDQRMFNAKEQQASVCTQHARMD